MARANPGLLSADGDKKGSQRLAGLTDGGVGKEDKKEQRRKKAAGDEYGIYLRSPMEPWKCGLA